MKNSTCIKKILSNDYFNFNDDSILAISQMKNYAIDACLSVPIIYTAFLFYK